MVGTDTEETHMDMKTDVAPKKRPSKKTHPTPIEALECSGDFSLSKLMNVSKFGLHLASILRQRVGVYK